MNNWQNPALAMNQLVDKIRQCRHVLLSTHKHCDGDGLGAQIALFHGLRQLGIHARVLNVDAVPTKYDFLQTQQIVQCFEGHHDPLGTADLGLIFDTNDSRLLEPLFTELKRTCREIAFVDHHPVLVQGPAPTPASLIDTSAASTGELAYRMLRALGVEMTPQIAQALYTSIVFDTQLFRYVRRSSNTHLIAAELLRFVDNPEQIHRVLFGNYTTQKMAFLARALSQIEYHADGRIAILRLHAKDMLEHELDLEESRDVIDFLMNIESLEAAVLFREDGINKYKLSLRSKGAFPILPIAEGMGGGGHLYSAGAYLRGNFENLSQHVLQHLLACLNLMPPGTQRPTSARPKGTGKKRHESA